MQFVARNVAKVELGFFLTRDTLLINKYTKHKLMIIRCQSQRLIWRRSESYNVLLSYLLSILSSKLYLISSS